MKKLLLILVTFACALCAQAQYENTTWQQRMGHGKDSTLAMEQQQLWTKYLNDNNNIIPCDAVNPNAFEESPRTWDATSYKAWKILFDKAPYSQFSIYQPTHQAGDMLRYLMYKEPDPAVKLIYFDDLMQMFDQYIENLNAINSVPGPSRGDYGTDKKYLLSDIKTWKAHYYYTEGKIFPPTVYKKETSYRLFSDAMTLARGEKSIEETEVYPYLILEYFNSCLDLYQSDKDKYYEQFLEDYLDCSELCRHMYENIPDATKAEANFNQYFPAFHNVDSLFKDTKATSRASLENHFKLMLESKKSDMNYINRACELMARFGDFPEPDQASVGTEYAKVAVENKSKANHFAMLIQGIALSKEYQEYYGSEEGRMEIYSQMRDAFFEAEKLAENDVDKALICYLIGQAMTVDANVMVVDPHDIQAVDNWANVIYAAMAYYNRAIELDPLHWKVASSYKIIGLYSALGYAYSKCPQDKKNEKGNMSSVEDYDKETRQTAVQMYRHAEEYYYKTFDAADEAYNQRCYEQDGKNMNFYQQNAGRLGLAAGGNANQIESTVASTLAKFRNATAAQKQTSKCTEKYHKYLANQAFWTSKTQKCIGCGRIFENTK